MEAIGVMSVLGKLAADCYSQFLESDSKMNENAHALEMTMAQNHHNLRMTQTRHEDNLALAREQNKTAYYMSWITTLGNAASTLGPALIGLVSNRLSEKDKLEAQTKMMEQQQRAYHDECNRLREEQKLAEDMMQTKITEIHAQQEQKMAEQTSLFEQTLKTQEKASQLAERIAKENDLISATKDLLDSRKRMTKDYKKTCKSINEKASDMNEILKKIAIESELILKFDYERNHKDCIMLVTLGETGVGKSTFGNRILGDKSEFGREGSFQLGDDFDSCTTIPTCRTNGKVSIVDTAGTYDCKRRDLKHEANLVKYLRGCGGVNAFLLFFNCANVRMSESYQNMILRYVEMLGEEAMEYFIVVATKADFGKNSGKDFYAQKWKKEAGKRISKELGLDFDLPVVSIGHDNYERSLQELLELIPKREKFNCESIKSPIDKYKKEFAEAEAQQEVLKQEKLSLVVDCGNVDAKIKTNTHFLNQNVRIIRNLQKDLGKDVREATDYDFDLRWEPLVSISDGN